MMNKKHFPPGHDLQQCAPHRAEKGSGYDTLAIVLLAFWLVAVGAGYTLHGFIYLLLAGAIMMVLIRFTQNRYANRVPVFLTIRRKK